MTSEQVDTTAPQEATPSVGEQLKSARIAQGKESQAVAAALHLDESTILALEADDKNSLPAAIFVQGYIQNYARLLGIPAEPLLAIYKASAPMAPALKVGSSNQRVKPSTPTGTMRFSKRRSSVKPLLILFGLSLVAIGWWLWPQLSSPDLTSSDESIALAPMGNSSTSSDDTGGINTSVAILPEVIKPESQPEVMAEVVLPSESVMEEPAPEVETVVELDQLMISSEEDSWIEISDAEQKRVMYRLLRGGSSHQVEGIAPFKVLLGYAQGVEITINGQSFDIAPHIVKNSARFSVERP